MQMKSIAAIRTVVAKATAAVLVSMCAATAVAVSASADPVTPCSFNPPLPSCPWSVDNPADRMGPENPDRDNNNNNHNN